MLRSDDKQNDSIYKEIEPYLIIRERDKNLFHLINYSGNNKVNNKDWQELARFVSTSYFHNKLS